MAIRINFVMDQGTKFEAIATIENEDGTIFDLTDMTPYCQMSKSYYSNTKYTITAEVHGDPINGEVKLTMLPSQSTSIRAGRYVYDVEVHGDLDPEYVKRVLEGVITVNPQVTSLP